MKKSEKRITIYRGAIIQYKGAGALLKMNYKCLRPQGSPTKWFRDGTGWIYWETLTMETPQEIKAKHFPFVVVYAFMPFGISW